MSKHRIAFLAGSIALAVSAAQAQTPAGAPVAVFGPNYYIGAGAVFMTRNTGGDRVLVTNDGAAAVVGAQGSPVFTSNGLNTFNWEPGATLAAGLRLGERWWLFGQVLWLNESRGSGNGAQTGVLALPFTADISTNFDGANRFNIVQQSQLLTGRLGAKYEWNGWLTLIGAFRVAGLSERINILMFDSGQGNYDLEAQNLLFGGEFGARIHHRVLPRLTVSLEATGGPFANVRSVRHFVLDSADARANRNETAQKTGFSFLGQGALTLRYELAPYAHLFAGYQAMVITGLALSQRELNFDTAGGQIARNVGVRGGGTVVYHGGVAGLKITW